MMPAPDRDSASWFATDVEPHEGALRSYLRREFPEHPDIDDLVQETYARLLRARDQKPVLAPRAFLFATARNAALDFFRRRKAVEIQGMAELDRLRVAEDKPGVPEVVCQDQELQLLAEAIEALPPRCREVITLRKIHGLSHREIARRLGIAENTVNAQVAFGVLRLRDHLRLRGVSKESR